MERSSRRGSGVRHRQAWRTSEEPQAPLIVRSVVAVDHDDPGVRPGRQGRRGQAGSGDGPERGLVPPKPERKPTPCSHTAKAQSGRHGRSRVLWG